MAMKSLAPATLKHWLDHNEALLIDVREPAEHAAEHITGAHLHPLGQISLDALPASDGKTLVIQCLKGGRGQAACEKLLAQRPDLEVYNLEGGLTAWRDAGLPTVIAHARARLPLDRQIQLTVGGGILALCTLALIIDPRFLWLTAIFGIGLSIAGLTGFCGLGIVLARMPWNRA